VEEMLGERADLSATYFELDEVCEALERVGFTVERAVERPPYEFELQTRRLYVLARRP
jgi:hypothetical protein